MKLLILGGTIFLGRHIVEIALKRGHDVTIFTRGTHNPDIFPTVEKLHGNRDGNLSALAGRTWDAVIDTSGYVPRIVKDSAEFLRDSVGHYSFVSSISVYKDTSLPNADEHADVATLDDESVEQITGETYGALKALCEQAAEKAMPGRVANVRPGLIVGPWDPSYRFTYWVERIAESGDILVPDKPTHPTQFIDARDLAEWLVLGAEHQITGTFNATGPDYPLTLGEVFRICADIAQVQPNFIWTSEDFLMKEEVGAYVELPLWVPGEGGFDSVNCDKAISGGLRFRPLAETVADTLAWLREFPAAMNKKYALTRERERELLGKWNTLHT